MAYLGQTFITRKSPGVLPHLWMVLSDPAKNVRVVLANLSSAPCPSGERCVIKRGEHSFVSHDSYVRFRLVRVEEREQLDKVLAGGMLKPSDALSPAVLKRVQEAVGRSRVVPTEAQAILRAQGFVA